MMNRKGLGRKRFLSILCTALAFVLKDIVVWWER